MKISLIEIESQAFSPFRKIHSRLALALSLSFSLSVHIDVADNHRGAGDTTLEYIKKKKKKFQGSAG